MADVQYKLTPMEKTQSIPVHWEFNQEDYDKLIRGHQSNWSVFLREDVVHVCRVGGEEFYRFKMDKTSDGIYMTVDVEMYASDDFYESARLRGWSEEKIKSHLAELRGSATQEVSGLLASYFSISVA